MYRWCSRCNKQWPEGEISCPSCGGKTDIELDINDTLRIDDRREFIITKQLSHYTDAGMSAVYLANRKDKPGMCGAIKVAKASRVEALEREAEHLQKLKHDGIIRLVHPEQAIWQDRKEDVTLHFFALEYMDGGSLKERLKQRNKLPLEEALSVILSIGEALEYAHQAGFVHLDVKPSNILFGSDGRIVLSDFGVTRDLSQANRLKKRVGTLFYNSPEQLTDNPVHTHKADIYALGIILYEMLVGADRFRKYRTSSSSKSDASSSPGAKAAAPKPNLQFEPLPPPRKLESRIPRSVEKVILKATALDPADRYDSVGAMMNDLVQAVSQPPPRPKLLLSLSGVGVLIAIASIVFGYSLIPPAVEAGPTHTPSATVEAIAVQTSIPARFMVATAIPPDIPITPTTENTPTITRSPTKTREPINTPTSTSTPAPFTSVGGTIELIFPVDNIQIPSDSIEFQWRWADRGCLQPPQGFAFEIRVWRDDIITSPQGAMNAEAEKWNIQCNAATGIRSFTIGKVWEVPGLQDTREGRARWDVALVRVRPYQPLIDTEDRIFYR